MHKHIKGLGETRGSQFLGFCCRRRKVLGHIGRVANSNSRNDVWEVVSFSCSRTAELFPCYIAL